MRRGFKRLLRGAGTLGVIGASVGAPGCVDEAPPSYQWRGVLEHLPGALLSVWGTADSNVYTVGSDARDGTGPLALRFDGARWTRLDTGLRRGTLWWVYGPTPSSVFMVGSGGTVLRHDPSTGRSEAMATPDSATTLFGVWGARADDVWAVGGVAASNTGVIWHYDGRAWSAVEAPDGLGARETFFKVWGNASNDVWIVGTNSVTLHWDGARWSSVSVPSSARGALFTVHSRGSERVAVGGTVSGTILEGDGSGWRQAALPDAPKLNGVWIPERGNPVAVGAQGAIFTRSGGVWQETARRPTTSVEFHGVWRSPEGTVWAVGGQVSAEPLTDGAIFRFGAPATISPEVTTPESITRCDREPGVICTWAGNGVAGFNGDGRPLRESSMYWPIDVEFAPDGAAVVLDWNNHRVRRATAAGTFETIIGTALPGDGPDDLSDLSAPGAMGDTVALNHPTDITFRDGLLYLVAWHNHKIRRWDPSTGRVLVTVGRGAGFAGDGAAASDARLKQPSHGAWDPAGNYYILDQANGRVRRINPQGIIDTVAGRGGRHSPTSEQSEMDRDIGDNGPAARAGFNWQDGENPEPEGGLAFSSDGAMYISDTGNHCVRRVDPTTQIIRAVVGRCGEFGFGGDGGPGASATLHSPQDIEVGPDGWLYIADTNNHRVRAWDPVTDVAHDRRHGRA
ncbi:MAG: hypothetical protein R3A48_06875 [Polyangiales bacterium]